ncbi:MAG: hypothetical protein WB992_19060 [Bryobacteraceae bacterium]
MNHVQRAGKLLLRAGGLLIGGLALVPSLLFCAQDASAPNAAEIIKRSVAANSSDWKAQPNYSYRERDTKSKVDEEGQTKFEQSRTYEVLMLGGSPYNRVIAVDNEPLTGVQEQQEQIKLNREIQRRHDESASAEQARLLKYQNERADERVLMQQMVKAFNFRLDRRENVDGFDCYLLTATPNAEYRPPVQKAKVLTGMKGRLWIDTAHFHWVKVEAEVTQAVEFGLFIAKVKPGTRFELDQAPVGDVWLPKRFTQTVNASLFGFYGMRSQEEDDYSDYRPATLNAGLPVHGN